MPKDFDMQNFTKFDKSNQATAIRVKISLGSMAFVRGRFVTLTGVLSFTLEWLCHYHIFDSIEEKVFIQIL